MQVTAVESEKLEITDLLNVLPREKLPDKFNKEQDNDPELQCL